MNEAEHAEALRNAEERLAELESEYLDPTDRDSQAGAILNQRALVASLRSYEPWTSMPADAPRVYHLRVNGEIQYPDPYPPPPRFDPFTMLRSTDLKYVRPDSPASRETIVSRLVKNGRAAGAQMRVFVSDGEIAPPAPLEAVLAALAGDPGDVAININEEVWAFVTRKNDEWQVAAKVIHRP